MTEVKIEETPQPKDDEQTADQTTVTVKDDASDETITQIADHLGVPDKEKQDDA